MVLVKYPKKLIMKVRQIPEWVGKECMHPLQGWPMLFCSWGCSNKLLENSYSSHRQSSSLRAQKRPFLRLIYEISIISDVILIQDWRVIFRMKNWWRQNCLRGLKQLIVPGKLYQISASWLDKRVWWKRYLPFKPGAPWINQTSTQKDPENEWRYIRSPWFPPIALKMRVFSFHQWHDFVYRRENIAVCNRPILWQTEENSKAT